MDLIIESGGQARCIYDETIALQSLGRLNVQRASHVEPNETGEWFADLSPVNGPLIGPFTMRSDALVAERAWLESYWLPYLATR
jgi:hypothetical protein